MAILAEYIWSDGTEPTPMLRSKTKVLDSAPKKIGDLPIWNFDGSSTNQAPGENSDCILQPVFMCTDPVRGGDNILVMNEVLNPDMTPHRTNTRRKAAEIAEKYAKQESWFGMEQEYTLFKGSRPLGFPENGGYPAAQGPYYCGVGDDQIFGRPLVEAHLAACVAAGLKISGINAEVMPGQWEFQIGPIGTTEVGDHMLVARWLLYRIGEDFGINATLDPKPVRGDWNGAGMHTNFSTKAMREGWDPIIAACDAMGEVFMDHVTNYGSGIEDRLTGKHETAPWNEFSYGVANRAASIRIPLQVGLDKKGYIEDRRPNSNADPYLVAGMITETVCAALEKQGMV